MFILDKSPELAVKSLVKKDILEYYNIFFSHFKCIVENIDILLNDDTNKRGYTFYKYKITTFNQATFNYYWEFFKYLEKAVAEIYDEDKILQRTFTNEDIEKLVSKFPEGNNVIYLRIQKMSKSILIKKKTSQDSVIEYNRLFYILKEYSANEFYYNIPVWYVSTNKVLLEKYSIKERKNIRITFIDNKYKYYIKDYQGVWAEIPNVPEIMQNFINALLFD